jgi:PAS domain S-box-containing protein
VTSLDPPEVTGLGLDEVLRQMPAAVVVVDARSRRIVYSNARARQMVEEQLGRPIVPKITEDWEIFHPDGRLYRTDEWPLVRSIVAGVEVVDEEYFNVRPDGSRLIVRCSSSPVWDEDGRIVAGVLVMSDITKERHAEEQLIYHARIADIVEDAVVGTDGEFRLTVWNRGAERLYGYAAAEVLGRDARDVGTYDGDPSRIELESELLETDRARTEFSARRKDGTRVEVEMIAVAVRGEQGEITGYLGVHRDVTARRRAEEALRASHRRLETVLESTTDSFIAVDRQWRFTYLNDRALRRLRERTGKPLTREELMGTDLWERMPGAVDAELHRQWHGVMDEQRPARFETYLPASDEWIESHLYPSPDGLSIYFRDVSERKRAAEHRERSASRQSAIAELGLRALASHDLRSLMNEAAAACARMLDVERVEVHELIGGGDELLLRAGIGWSDAAAGGVTVVDGDAVSSLLAAHGAAAGVCVLIEGRDRPFGALGAFAARPRSFSAMDVDFVQAIANVLAAAVERATAEERLLEVREVERRRIARDLHDEALQDLSVAVARAAKAAPGPDTPEDALAHLVPALERVGLQLRGAIYDLRLGDREDRPFPELLEGLIDVQRALADRCEILLTIGADVPSGPLGRRGTGVLRIVGEAVINARRHADARRVRVDVSGSAEGLHVEVADDGRGFDPRARRDALGGTGIAGMRERAALLEGVLRITSEPGAGTRVRFELPLADAPDAADSVARILLVEDHAAVREAIAAMFEREPDFRVVGQASSLAEARGLLHGVDVAVLDIGLPDGDGTELIEELSQASPHAEALVLSATLDRAQAARAIERGAAGTLDKTAHLDEVVDAVRRLRAGETLLPLDEVAELLRFAGRQREQERADREAIGRLTPREREVLQALGDGLDSQAIARRLGISPRTQRNHVASILGKLGVHSQLQAVLFGLRYDLIEVR